MSAPQQGRETPSDRACGPNGSGLVLAAGGNGNAVLQRSQGANVSESPSERLRRAADLVERRAAAATPGPWQPEHSYDGHCVQAVFVECDGEDCDHDRYGHADGTCAIGAMHSDPDNRWAILAGPQIGEHLAAWLRQTADSAAHHIPVWQAPPSAGIWDDEPPPRRTPEQLAELITHHYGHALALADEILRGEAP